MRKFLCLYLNTGGGHRAPAKVLKQVMEQSHSDASVELLNGFDEKNRFARFFFERCYQIACNFVPGSWRLVYEVCSLHWIQRLLNMIIMPHTSWHLKNAIKEHNATDVICFHFILTPSAISAIRRLHKKINFTVVVTDPFSAPTTWFFQKDIRYIVFSERVKQFAVTKCSVPIENISVMPFLIDPKFYAPFTTGDEQLLRKKYKIPHNKKVLLLVGGGEGLPHSVHIVQQLLKRNPEFTILVVCGKDIASKKVLDVMAQLHPSIDLRPMGFISNMDEMIHLCDCAIVKAGASTIFEILVSGKPPIISTFLHGQELGNVQFAVRNGVGWFVRKPKNIATAVYSLLEDEAYFLQTKERLEKLPISKDIQLVADHLWEQ